ncbi:TPA: hypothetical protein ACMDPH_001765 [Vibrio cholerae]
MTLGAFIFAALLEIAGCYAFWVWWKLDKSMLWLIPGIVLRNPLIISPKCNHV